MSVVVAVDDDDDDDVCLFRCLGVHSAELYIVAA